jgi:hypothetical protein
MVLNLNFKYLGYWPISRLIKKHTLGLLKNSKLQQNNDSDMLRLQSQSGLETKVSLQDFSTTMLTYSSEAWTT